MMQRNYRTGGAGGNSWLSKSMTAQHLTQFNALKNIYIAD
jgi:hypothetical protein